MWRVRKVVCCVVRVAVEGGGFWALGGVRLLRTGWCRPVIVGYVCCLGFDVREGCRGAVG